jgi:sialic acid synthase SpsE
MVEFIAEISSNHSRDLSRCLEFVDVAAEIGCSVVKFQLFKIDQLFSQEAFIAKPFLKDRKKWELPIAFLPPIYERCLEKGIRFSCTPFYLQAVKELEPFVSFYKIASYELLWNDLLTACSLTGKSILLSTGMATIEEILSAVALINRVSGKKPMLLHCTSSYPTPYFEANLSAIDTIRNLTGCEVGWSDHTVEPGVIHRAVSKWGAKFVEFHLDLDGTGDEFKTGHCWLPDKIGTVIQDVKKSLASDGSGCKEPVPSEIPDRKWRADPSDGLRPLKDTRFELLK